MPDTSAPDQRIGAEPLTDRPERPRLALCLRSDLLDRIEEHAVEALPEECCGILIGSAVSGRAVVDQILSTPNVWPGDRRKRYEIDPQVAFEALRKVAADGRSVVGFYHSHTDGTSAPSGYVLDSAWPGKVYLIIGARAGRPCSARAWLLHDTRRKMIELPVS